MINQRMVKVYSALIHILIFRQYEIKKMLFSLFSSIPGIAGMKVRNKECFFFILHSLFLLLVARASLQVGILFMDELQGAVAPFLPGTSGGMAGAPTPGPSSSGWTALLASSGDGGSPHGHSEGAVDQPQPGMEEDELSPAERRVKQRLDMYKKDPEYILPLEDLKVRLEVKGEIIDKMSELDPHSFWIERREAILSESILTKAGREYQLDTLNNKLEELRETLVWCSIPIFSPVG